MNLRRIKKLSILTIILAISTFIIYKVSYKDEIIYVALGDSLALGTTPYGNTDYGYSDYIKDYLSDKDKLGYFNKEFAKNGYKTDDIIEDIYNNRGIIKDEKMITIKKALREANLVTISLGANDILQNISFNNIKDKLSSIEELKRDIDEVIEKVDETLLEVKKYAKGNIVVIGYYNPFPRLTNYKKDIDELIDYSNIGYKKICDKNNVYYLKISHLLSDKDEFFPNPLDIHPNSKGYRVISDEFINFLNNQILK